MDVQDQPFAMRLERIEGILENQYNMLQEVRQNAQRTRRYIFWGRMVSLVYLLIVILPIIVAAIYLPPYLREFSGVLRANSGGKEAPAAPFRDVRQLLDELKKGY